MAYIKIGSYYNYGKLKNFAWSLLIIGGIIYLFYRPHGILLFQITDFLGLTSYIDIFKHDSFLLSLPDFVIFSLPAGLWTASYLLLMFANTTFLSRKNRLLISLPLPVSAILLEFLQLFGWCPGIFDIYDLACYTIPIIIFIKNV